MCGKNSGRCYRWQNCMGSPPRVREKLWSMLPMAKLYGITPACAGKTRSLKHSLLQTWDHPRVCGKNIHKQMTNIRTTGSPPRVREKLHFSTHIIITVRITPACAGKTSICKGLPTQKQDHPRVCGKNRNLLVLGLAIMGSPPRVREKQVNVKALLVGIGITPACAGKTSSSKMTCGASWDHPRVCGKNATRRKRHQSISGSPPRVREKLSSFHRNGTSYGITPACAGKT